MLVRRMLFALLAAGAALLATACSSVTQPRQAPAQVYDPSALPPGPLGDVDLSRTRLDRRHARSNERVRDSADELFGVPHRRRRKASRGQLCRRLLAVSAVEPAREAHHHAAGPAGGVLSVQHERKAAELCKPGDGRDGRLHRVALARHPPVRNAEAGRSLYRAAPGGLARRCGWRARCTPASVRPATVPTAPASAKRFRRCGERLPSTIAPAWRTSIA